MGYGALLDLLPESEELRVSTLPDGSVDRFFRIRSGSGYVERRETFGERVLAGEESFRTEHWMTTPGGQSVNMAQQAAALGDDVTAYGHLDHPVFHQVPVEQVSMGAPAIVSILTFEHSDVMFSEESRDLLAWTLCDLASVADIETVFSADAVCWGNWVSLPDATAALGALPDRVDAPDTWFVFDPGNLTHETDIAIAELLDVLAALPFEVVLSVDRIEAERLGAVVDETVADDADVLRAIRRRAGLSGVVLHDVPRAHVATVSGYRSLENLETTDVVRTVGAGDRFTAGLAHALAHDWEWEVALALGNACASFYVERGETGDVESLVQFLQDRA